MVLFEMEIIEKEEELLTQNFVTNQESTFGKNEKNTEKYLNARRRDNYGPNEDRRIYKNLIALAISFLLLFTSFMSMSNLQSSLNEEGGLGAYSLATVYVALSLSSLFLPSLVIQKLTCKWTLVFSMIGYMIYIIAQFYPTFATLIPAGLILGICAAPLWSAQSTYLSKLGEEYAYLTSTASEIVLQRFFGLFFLFFQTCQIWGNLISSLLLSAGVDTIEYNDTKQIDFSTCGANYCPSSIYEPNLNISILNDNEMIQKKPTHMGIIYVMSAIFLLFSIAAALITWLFVDSLARYGENQNSSELNSSAKQLTLATIQHWTNPKQLLLIPATIWLGFQSAFLGADYNLGYVACAWGVHYIGYCMIAYGIADGLSSYFFGRVTNFTGRAPVFILSGLLYLTSLITTLLWSPTPEEPHVFIIITVMWGLADGILLPQMTALYGTIFAETKEAAFSNSRLWTSIGFIIAYIMSTHFCMDVKIYFCIILLVLSLVFYLILEVPLRIEDRRTIAKSNGNNNL